MSYLLTFTGKHLDLIDPQPNMINLLDIAHGLANTCRFSGQCRFYYSVAQHSELASRIVPVEFELEALLHDAAEAYLCDIPSPLKLLLPDYRAIEARMDAAIRERFGLPATTSPEVKQADLVMLATEKRDLMPPDRDPWPLLYCTVPLDFRIMATNANRAKSGFMQRALEILQEAA
ncbi:MAG: hypothetical protein H6R18_1910 [Proteobacteria bacterium]|nr:hypothetical protein [Pseudomonadota bacterium]